MAYYSGKEGNYTIKSGDTLGKIAKNAGVTVKDLQAWNNIADVNKIRAGAKLYTSQQTVTPSVAPSVAPHVAPSVAPVETQPSIVNVINGNKTINEGDVYKTGAETESSLPKATANMANNGIEFDWTKEGRVQGFLEEQQKVQEARRAAIEQKSKIDYGKEIQDAGKLEVVTNQNQNKMGITGLAADDLDRRVSIATNARALNLYSQEEMIKYGYESGVKIATLFGDLKERQVTAEEYNKAVDRAYTEGQITGVYFDPIQMQLLNQGNMAKAMLNNPYATADEKARAKSVNDGIRTAFLEMGLSDKGRDTLEKLYQQQSIALQKQANSIASAGNALTANNIKASANAALYAAVKELPKRPTAADIRKMKIYFKSNANVDTVLKMYDDSRLDAEGK